jgi:RimJ/RimL family protein N-acetyltransferase
VRSHLYAYAPLSLAQEERWFEGIDKDPRQRVFAIEGRDEEAPEAWTLLGGCGLHEIDFKNGRAGLGIYLGEPATRGKGAGTEAMRLLLAFAFGELRLHRVELEVYEENARARALYEKLGFVVEGRRRDAIFKGGEYKSPVVMSVLEHEHRAREAARASG